jgi:hypothetical protein
MKTEYIASAVYSCWLLGSSQRTYMVVTDPELPSHVTPAQVQQLAQAALIQEFISEDCEF